MTQNFMCRLSSLYLYFSTYSYLAIIKVKLQDDEVYIVNVRCSGAATILMAETGILYAYGENNENRLGLGKMFKMR